MLKIHVIAPSVTEAATPGAGKFPELGGTAGVIAASGFYTAYRERVRALERKFTT